MADVALGNPFGYGTESLISGSVLHNWSPWSAGFEMQKQTLRKRLECAELEDFDYYSGCHLRYIWAIMMKLTCVCRLLFEILRALSGGDQDWHLVEDQV